MVVVSYSDSCTTVMPLSKQMDYVMGRSLWMLLPTCQVRFVTFTRQTCCCLCTSQVTHTRYSSIITQKYQYSCLGMALKGESEAMRANKIYMKDQSGVKLPQINPFGWFGAQRTSKMLVVQLQSLFPDRGVTPTWSHRSCFLKLEYGYHIWGMTNPLLSWVAAHIEDVLVGMYRCRIVTQSENQQSE